VNFKQIRIRLVKILVYFAILLVLAVFLLPALKTGRDRCNTKYACYSNLKQIGLSLKQYAMDYEDYFPPGNNAQGLEKLRSLDYLTDYGVYVCPKKRTRRGTEGHLAEASCGYIYLGGFKDDGSGDVPLAFDKPGNHPDYVNVLFIDGHVKGYSTSASGSCEEIIVFLNEEYKYPPELFKKLLDEAKKTDRTLPHK
jgi:prepilin-type processing-associated H-X9-DG protein